MVEEKNMDLGSSLRADPGIGVFFPSANWSVAIWELILERGTLTGLCPLSITDHSDCRNYAGRRGVRRLIPAVETSTVRSVVPAS